VNGITLLCPNCASPLDEALRCAICHAAFRHDTVSGAVLLHSIPARDDAGTATAWDEVWTARETAAWGSNLRLRQRRQLFIADRAATRVLEVGIGSGFNIALVDASRIESYVGLDLSLPALRQAHRTLSAVRVPHTLISCDVTKPLPLVGHFDTIFLFGILYQFERYVDILASILDRHAGSGTVVYGAEPIHAIGSSYRIERTEFLQFLRSRGDVRAWFMEGLLCRAARKLRGPNWLVSPLALQGTPSARRSPFAYYMQYVLQVDH
jgi:protein-L-isoaspartate O-methyltransferase